LVRIEEVFDWSVVGLSASRISLILGVRVVILVEVQYENRADAMYDREDHVWIGTESAYAEVEDDAEIEVIVDVDRNAGEIRNGKILTPEVRIRGRWPGD
jgi:hypothetical protein